MGDDAKIFFCRQHAEMTLTQPKAFAKMTREELLGFCRELYAKDGVSALSYPSLKAIPKLYFHLYANGLPQKTLLQELGIATDYKQHLTSRPYKYGDSTRSRWTWDALVERANAIKSAEGRLPPALWFQTNGHAAFVQALYNLGHTWDQLREAVGDFTDSNFVQSRNGLRWLSHAEASLSNYLYARGIEHKKGERYKVGFAAMSPSKYAIYDLHLKGKDGYWFDVEVWGDKPNGHAEDRYALVRQAKEKFNAGNLRFIGIHHSECYSDGKLDAILHEAIGVIKPFQFDKPTDALIYSTHWSNADELLDFCKDLASKMPRGEFPAEDWLRKRGKWAGRDGEAYNTLSLYIKQWLGGIRNLRKLIGQSDVSTLQWDKPSAIAAYKAFYERHGLTPNQARTKSRKDAEGAISSDVAAEAIRIASAIEKYAGGSDAVMAELGITIKRQTKWSTEVLLNTAKSLYEKYGLTPNQLVYQHRTGKMELPLDERQKAARIVDAATRYPGGMAAIRNKLIHK
jgi:hypothetical protein